MHAIKLLYHLYLNFTSPFSHVWWIGDSLSPIDLSLSKVSVSGTEGSLLQKIQSLEKENQELRQGLPLTSFILFFKVFSHSTVTQNLSALVKNMVERVTALEKGAVNAVAKPEAASAPAAAPAKEESDEDDFDLFGEEQEEVSGACCWHSRMRDDKCRMRKRLSV